MTDTKTFSAMLVTEAVMRGIATAGDVKELFFRHDNALFSFLATTARFRLLEAITIQSMVETSKRPLDEILMIKKKADLATAIHLVTLDMLTPEAAVQIYGVEPDYQDLLKKAAEFRDKGVSREELEKAIGELNVYLRNKAADGT